MYFQRICLETGLISPKPAQVSVRRKLQLFNIFDTFDKSEKFSFASPINVL